MTDFTTWQALATYAGATAAVTVLIQLFKGSLEQRFPNIPVRMWVYLLALLILVAADFFTGAGTAASLSLCFINAALVAVASMGSYDAFIQGKVKKKEDE